MAARYDARQLSVIALLIGAGAVGWQVWSSEIDVTAIRPLPESAGGTPQVPYPRHADIQLPPPESFSETLARPLFSPSRRPVERVAEAVPTRVDAPPASDGLRLLGVVRRGETSRALVATQANPSGAWLVVGQALGGWRLAEIMDDAVQLSSGRHAQVLALYRSAARENAQ